MIVYKLGLQASELPDGNTRRFETHTSILRLDPYDASSRTMNFDPTNGQHEPRFGWVSTLEVGNSIFEYTILCSPVSRV